MTVDRLFLSEAPDRAMLGERRRRSSYCNI
jgi:hypothetical protein